jgi:selenide,water dikinase
MGITNIDNMLMILSVSITMPENEREIVTREMMKGFNDKATEAGVIITGGQTVKNPWAMIGGTAISVLPKKDVIYPNNTKAGDIILLTKPLGTQVPVNLAQWLTEKNEKWQKCLEYISEEDLWKAYSIGEKSMCKLNNKSAALMHKFKVGACTDVTGFGIRGHLENLAVAQKQSLDFHITKLPIISKMDIIDKNVQNFKLRDGYSPETSGGLMIIIDESDAQKYVEEMEKIDEKCWVIGHVTSGERNIIMDDAQVISVNEF